MSPGRERHVSTESSSQADFRHSRVASTRFGGVTTTRHIPKLLEHCPGSVNGRPVASGVCPARASSSGQSMWATRRRGFTKLVSPRCQ